MSIPAEKISQNWEIFTGYIGKYIKGERKKLLFKFYEKHQDELVLMPASHKKAYHNAFPCGFAHRRPGLGREGTRLGAQDLV